MDKNFRGTLLTNERLENLDQFALYDKIINLKFILKAKTDGKNSKIASKFFTIRSDYELVDNGKGGYCFQQIKQKPSIKIHYMQMSEKTNLPVEITIDNFYFVNPTEQYSLFSAKGNIIESIIIQMGYRHQFPDWTKGVLSKDTEESQDRIKQFYALEEQHTVKGSIDTRDTGMSIVVKNIASIELKGMPPNSKVIIKGFVGTTDWGLRWFDKDKSLAQTLKENSNFPKEKASNNVATNYSPLEKLLFLTVTRRFIKNNVVHKIIDSRDEIYGSVVKDKGSKREQKLFVYDYDTATQKFFSSKEQTKKDEEERWAEVSIGADGCLPVKDAIAIGVTCVVSEGLRIKSNRTTRLAFNPTGRDVELNDVAKIPHIGLQNTLEAQLRMIKQTFPFLKFTTCPNGTIFFYDADELIEEIHKQPAFVKANRYKKPLVLPAIYDIQLGETPKIKCPFVSFIAPQQLINFSTSYRLGNFIGYYYQPKNNSWFRVLWSDVTFATVDEDNLMELTCVISDEPKKEDMANYTAKEQTDIAGASSEQSKRTLEWLKVNVIKEFAGNQYSRVDKTTCSSWTRLADYYILKDAVVSKMLFKDEKPTLQKAIQKMLEENENNNKNFVTKKLDERGVAGAEALFYKGKLNPLPCIIYVDDTILVPSVKIENA